MNIVVVDDDIFELKLLESQLQQLHCSSVTICDQARDVVSRLDRKQPVDIIFCDLLMPGMDGVELVRHLARSGYQGSIVLMSGEDERILDTVRSLALAHDLRVLDAIRKPLTSQQLQWVLLQNARAIERPVRLARRLFGSEELHKALSLGQFVNHYQPKVSARSGELVGVEALVRWQHPTEGLVYPDQFIPTAEQTGLIDELTRVVLVEGVMQLARWQREGLELTMAVNISMHSLGALTFPEFVEQTVTSLGVDSSRLVLEVTESQLMLNPVDTLDTLARLRLKNITLSIDDFGTGHSSLRQLRDVPFNELKIDYGFVHQAWRNRSRRTILEASLDMAEGLGMHSVAEGVEDQDDWNFLINERHCDLLQGYFIGKPMPASELPSWLTNWCERRQKLLGQVG